MPVMPVNLFFLFHDFTILFVFRDFTESVEKN
jgi:hypothetical protein